MTGFGSAEVQWENWFCVTEIRSVNHRFLDINCRLPSFFQKLEQEFKSHIKSICLRGKIDCFIRLEKNSRDDELHLNTEEAKNIKDALKKVSTKEKSLIVIFGSLYLIGHALSLN